MLASALVLAATLGAQPFDANALLDRGPIVSVDQTAEGKFKQCTAVARVDAPVERVWQVVTDYKDFHNFIPKVVGSEVIHEEPNVVDVKFEIDVPGVNTKYVMRHTLHADTHTIEMNWVKGDLKGSHWIIHLEPTADGRTLLSYAGASKNFSSILESLEDSQQTISVGVNVSSALTAVKAFKRQSEAKP